MNTSYLIRYLSRQLHTIVRSWAPPLQDGRVPDVYCARMDLTDSYFPDRLLSGSLMAWRKENPCLPLLFSIGRDVCYAFVPAPELDLLIGPVRFSSPVRMNRNIEGIPLPDDELSAAPVCEFSDFTGLVLLAGNLQHPTALDLDDLVAANCMDSSMDDAIMEDLSALVFDRREQEQPHNPYDQELREFTSIEQGDIPALRKSLQEDYTGKIGTLAKDEVRQMRNRAIVVITLASRAAIRGGLLPEISFSMSDVFIQRIEEETDTAVLLNIMHQFEFRYAEMVAELNAQKAGRPKKDQNPRVELCKDYIFRHLHEKISVRDMAGELFLNANYLSEIFRQHEGMTITDFIVKEKVNLTKNLLSYSPYTYSEIAAYLGFSSQSHLGKVFKKLTGLTLKQYRDRYGVREF